ncbi:MAG TPA: hypothetical protein VE776_06395 [Actinomycetota bacterium]|nr:hypothetical protein [Actinomycetota bacterium]
MAGAGPIKHLIYLQFDNVHLQRNLASVPSDLEQMPHLLNFVRSNGTLLTNDHTVLVSHTANGILTSLTSRYPDRQGQPVSNSYRYYKPDGTSGLGVSFAYWTDSVFDPTTPTPADTSFNMITADGRNDPAPWVPFTRAGCNWGAAGAANTVLENIGPDVPKVFGPNSPEAAEVAADPKQAFADFVGIAVHCAKGAGMCSAQNHGRPDLLPDEPGGYDGYQALFGHKYVAPQITVSLPLKDLDGNVIQDAAGHVGFPGFDGVFPSVTLSYIAQMQEHGVPVTFGYISDAHDDHGVSGEIHKSFGPGEAGYVQQLRDYDRAFAAFFARLERDGITKDNTLFVITTEEEDHFVGGTPLNPGCDGVTTPCQWTHVDCTIPSADCSHNVTEVNANLRGLLATQAGNTTPFQVHSDMAPAFYLDGNPTPDAAVTRQFERDVGSLTALNPITGQTDRLSDKLVDRVGMDALHMTTGDPLRTPTFVDFLDDDYFGFAGAANCTRPCVTAPGSWSHATFAWNHGGYTPDIVRVWAGLVGPGVRDGRDDTTWVDHTDLRPTILTLSGLSDDYSHDGRVITEILDTKAVPQSLRAHRETLERLGAAYKQINAPLGRFGLDVIKISDTAVRSTNEARYAQLSGALQQLGDERDTIAARMRVLLERAAFGNASIDEQAAKGLIAQAAALLARADTTAASS